MYRILHLSDIHIGKTFALPRQIGAKLANNIKDVYIKELPDRVIVTGDIFEKTEDESKREGKISDALTLFVTCTGEMDRVSECRGILKE